MSAPEKVFRIGLVSASVFTNEIETEGGKKQTSTAGLYLYCSNYY